MILTASLFSGHPVYLESHFTKVKNERYWKGKYIIFPVGIWADFGRFKPDLAEILQRWS